MNICHKPDYIECIWDRPQKHCGDDNCYFCNPPNPIYKCEHEYFIKDGNMYCKKCNFVSNPTAQPEPLQPRAWKQGCSCYQGLIYNADPNCTIHGEPNPISKGKCEHDFYKPTPPNNPFLLCKKCSEMVDIRIKKIRGLKDLDKGMYPWEDDMVADYIIENRNKINAIIDVINGEK